MTSWETCCDMHDRAAEGGWLAELIESLTYGLPGPAGKTGLHRGSIWPVRSRPEPPSAEVPSLAEH
jgi:hypothetical protein